MIPAADLAMLYDTADGLTVTATVGAESAAVFFDAGDADALSGDRIVRDYRMRYWVGAFESLAKGDAVTINAVSYRVLEVRQLDSGVECVARLGTV
jgi:hypothetical protein